MSDPAEDAALRDMAKGAGETIRGLRAEVCAKCEEIDRLLVELEGMKVSVATWKGQRIDDLAAERDLYFKALDDIFHNRGNVLTIVYAALKGKVKP